jgi:hypothetical protein
MARKISSKPKQGTPAELVQAGCVSAAAADGNGNPDLFREREETARIAYLFWEARGYQGGSPEEDWFRAEQELRRKLKTEARGKSSLHRPS